MNRSLRCRQFTVAIWLATGATVLWPRGASSAPRVVQWNAARAAGSNLRLPFHHPTRSGNTIIAAVGSTDHPCDGARPVVDSELNDYKTSTVDQQGFEHSAIWYSRGVSAANSGVTEVEVNCQSSVDSEIVILEYTGLDPAPSILIEESGASSLTTTFMDSGTVTPASGSLLFGWGRTAGGIAVLGAGYESQVMLFGKYLVEDMTAVGSGPTSATATSSSPGWSMQLAAFPALADAGSSSTEADASGELVGGQIWFVQSSAASAYANSVTISLPAASGSGNTLVLCSFFNKGFKVVVSDSANNQYRNVAPPGTVQSPDLEFQISYAAGIHAGTQPIEVTATSVAPDSGGAPYQIAAYLLEYSGLASPDPLDGFSGFATTDSSGGSQELVESGTVQTTADGDLLIGFAGSLGQIVDAGVGFSNRLYFWGNMVEDEIAQSAGSHIAAAISNHPNRAIVAAAFKAAPQDAGRVDAGSFDAGGVDAGSLDAGSVDAGPTDDGGVDADPKSLDYVATPCGCSSSGLGALFLLGLGLGARRSRATGGSRFATWR